MNVIEFKANGKVSFSLRNPLSSMAANILIPK